MRLRHSHPNALVLASVMVVASGCVMQSHRVAAPLPGKPACIFSSSVQDWVVLDDQTLIVHAPLRKDPYLIKLFSPIIGLQFHESIGFLDGDHNGQLCSTGDSIVVQGAQPQRSPILAVRLLTPAQATQLETRAGVKFGAVHSDSDAAASGP